MLAFANRIEQGARTWGHVMSAGCAPVITLDALYATAASRLPVDDPVLLRQVLTGCVVVSGEINHQLYRQARAPYHDQLARTVSGLSPELAPAKDVKTAAHLMQLWSMAHADGDAAALRRYVPVVNANTKTSRRLTVAAMMMAHMHGELAQLSPLGRSALAETFAVAPLRADPRAHILAALWAEGTSSGNLNRQRTVMDRLYQHRRRVAGDVLWVCARTAAAGVIPGHPVAIDGFGCECSTGEKAAQLLAEWISWVGGGAPGMHKFVQVQYGQYADRDPDLAEHLLSVGVAWLARRFIT